MSVRNCFIRGSVVRYVQLPPGSVDTEILHDATHPSRLTLQVLPDADQRTTPTSSASR